MKHVWLVLTLAAIGWYIFVTAYVAYKGLADIKEMLQRLSDKK